MLAAALHSMLSNPATRWMQLRTRDRRLAQDRDVALWLDDASDVLHAVFEGPQHGFVTAQTEKYLDLIYYGTGGMFIDEVPGTGPLFRSYPLQELWLTENGKGKVDGLDRRFKISAVQAVQEFEDPSAEVMAAASDPAKMDDEFEFIHSVFPREERNHGASDDRNMAFASIYVDVKAKKDRGRKRLSRGSVCYAQVGQAVARSLRARPWSQGAPRCANAAVDNGNYDGRRRAGDRASVDG